MLVARQPKYERVEINVVQDRLRHLLVEAELPHQLERVLLFDLVTVEEQLLGAKPQVGVVLVQFASDESLVQVGASGQELDELGEAPARVLARVEHRDLLHGGFVVELVESALYWFVGGHLVGATANELEHLADVAVQAAELLQFVTAPNLNARKYCKIWVNSFILNLFLYL